MGLIITWLIKTGSYADYAMPTVNLRQSALGRASKSDKTSIVE